MAYPLLPLGPLMRVMMIAAACVLALAPPVLAQSDSEATTPAPDRAVDVQSEAFALLSDSLLLRGDRDGALTAALQGLPDDPLPEDFERFEAAHLMLYRAMAARVLRLPIDDPAFATLGPNGRRMAVGGPQPALYAMPEGTEIARLRRADGSAFDIGDAPAFDPDGERLVVVESRRPVLHVYDAGTGAHLTSVTLPSRPLAFYEGFASILLSVGFSHDGRVFAVETIDNLFLLDLEDQSVHDHPSLGAPHWLPDRRLLLVDFPVGPAAAPGAPVLDLRLRDGDTVTPLFTLVAQEDGLRSAPQEIRVNQSGTALLAITEGNGVVIDGSGALRAILPDGLAQEARFVRNGTALAVPGAGGALTEAIMVVSLTGDPVTPRFSDFALFDRGLFDPSGMYLTFGSMDGPTARYDADDLPRGRPLWDAAMNSLSPASRAAVAANRITRD